MNYAMSKLGWFGHFLVANPVALTSIGVVAALIALTVMVVSESSKEILSPIYEHRDKRFMRPSTPKRWIVGFTVTMVVIIAVISFGTYKYWQHTSHSSGTHASTNTNAKVEIPAGPIANGKSDTTVGINHPKKRPHVDSDYKHQEPQQQVSQPAQQAAQQPHSLASVSSPVPAQSQLERVVGTNRRLSQGDRERLSNLLYEFSQTLDKMEALAYKANQEIAKIGNEVRDGSIVKHYEAHLKTLGEISESGKEMAKTFLGAREAEKWRYYSDQMGYVFGDNPDNLGPNSIINATGGYAVNLSRWSAIKDRENKDALNLLEAPRIESERLLHAFFDWERGCKLRLEQMRLSIR
jgi:hypothetical protein